MATNYSFERGKYGVFPGTIIAFPRTLDGNNPNGVDFKTRIPAGFLRSLSARWLSGFPPCPDESSKDLLRLLSCYISQYLS